MRLVVLVFKFLSVLASTLVSVDLFLELLGKKTGLVPHYFLVLCSGKGPHERWNRPPFNSSWLYDIKRFWLGNRFKILRQLVYHAYGYAPFSSAHPSTPPDPSLPPISSSPPSLPPVLPSFHSIVTLDGSHGLLFAVFPVINLCNTPWRHIPSDGFNTTPCTPQRKKGDKGWHTAAHTHN